MPRTEAVVDLGAIRANTATLRAATNAELLAVVKADGYGHGLLPSAQAALAGGASWLGTAVVSEALALRGAGITAPVFCWLFTPADAPLIGEAIAADIDVSVNGLQALEIVLAQAADVGTRARIHLKIDTGLTRNGADRRDWSALVGAAAAAQVQVVGIWSHFACADTPGDPSITAQLERFEEALKVAADAGIHPEYRHIANSAATLTLPQAHYDLVRPGVALYGLNPLGGPAAEFGLHPAMTLRAELAQVKRVAAGEGISYGHQYITDRESTVALVPLGYADGVPRAAAGRGPVQIGGQLFQISGRVCMDQFVVDVDDLPVNIGDVAVLFGGEGAPTVQDWADVCQTIHYEIVTRLGPRIPRTYVGQL